MTHLPQSLLLLEVKVLIHLGLICEAQRRLEEINSGSPPPDVHDQLQLYKALIYSSTDKV